MPQIIIIMAALIFSSCIFVPDEPPAPSGKFTDNLNLDEIFSGTGISFLYENYYALFKDTVVFYIDKDRNEYSTQSFIQRLSEINSDTEVSCSWTAESEDPSISMAAPATLGIRRFVLSSDSFGEKTGTVRITINFGNMGVWQITKWEERDENYSFFHPVYYN